MPQLIPPVGNSHVNHGMVLDLVLTDGTTYRIANTFDPITVSGNAYTALGSLLYVESVTNDIKTTNGDLKIGLTEIPGTAIGSVFTAPILGASVRIQRVFFGENNYQYTGTPYPRYFGIVQSYDIEEQVSEFTGERINTLVITTASLNKMLERKITGQFTNTASRQRYYPGDISFDRVVALQGVAFDFGRRPLSGSGFGGGGGFAGGSGGTDIPTEQVR
jgi:hypothetical protein